MTRLRNITPRIELQLEGIMRDNVTGKPFLKRRRLQGTMIHYSLNAAIEPVSKR